MTEPTPDQIAQEYAKALAFIAAQRLRIEALEREIERLSHDPRLKLPDLTRKPAAPPAPEAHP